MRYFYTTIITLSLLFLPTASLAQVDVDPHTNIPDTDQYVANQIGQFTRFMNSPDISQAELSQALADIRGLLESYERILKRRAN